MAFSAAVGNVMASKKAENEEKEEIEGVVVENPLDGDDENDFDHIMSVLVNMKESSSSKSR